MSEHEDLGLSPVVIGQLIENMKRGTEDRHDMKRILEKLNDGQEALRRDVAGLQQTASSTATALAGMISEHHAERIKALETFVFDDDHKSHGERITWMEEKIKTWDGWIGSGKSALVKLATILLGSAVLQAAAYKWLMHQ